VGDGQDKTVSYTRADKPSGLNRLVLHAQAKKAGSAVEVSDLVLTPDDSPTPLEPCALAAPTAGKNVQWSTCPLQPGAGKIKLTGKLKFTWDAGNVPKRSELLLGVKIFKFPSCGTPPDSSLQCPVASDKPENVSLMNRKLWFYHNQADTPVMDHAAAEQWPDGPGGGWLVKVPYSGDPNTPPPPVPGGPNNTRHQYDIMTYCCFGDYYLEVEFRCPNMRDKWTDCASGLTGPRNWGNSGVIVQNCYEIQILDSHNVPVPAGIKPDDATEMGECMAGAQVRYGELCGALYLHSVPIAGSNPLNEAKNAAGVYPYQPDGDWNKLEVWFMSARYHGRAPAKLATFSVKINDQFVLQRQGIAVKTSGSRNAPGYFGRIADVRYAEGYKMDVGPLVLQEHDNQVEFKGLTLDLSWMPKKSDDSFDEAWQEPA
jgi:hypothetical protein